MEETPKNQQQVLEFVEQCEIKDGVLESPVLYSIDTHDKFRRWQIFVGIAKVKKTKDGHKIVESIEVTDDYINREELPDGYCGVYWTISGRLDRPQAWTKSAITPVTKISYPNGKNFTTPFTQAVIKVRSLFNHNTRKGHVLDTKLLKKKGEVTTIEELINDPNRGDTPWRVFMMAVHNVRKNNNWQHINFPCYIQPKYDGMPVVIVSHPELPEKTIKFDMPERELDDDEAEKKLSKKEIEDEAVPPNKIEEIDEPAGAGSGKEEIDEEDSESTPLKGELKTYTMHIDAYSRKRENAESVNHILVEIYPVLKKYPSLYVIGETWKKGYGLQDISGSGRRTADSKLKSKAVVLDYYIFDCFYLDQPNMPFEERWAILDDLMFELKKTQIYRTHGFTHLIDTQLVSDRKTLDGIYAGYIANKLEGAVLRNVDSPHMFGLNKELRSYTTMKMKDRDDDEWPVVGFTQGDTGKDIGAIIWVCAENDEGVKKRVGKVVPLEERKTYTVAPNQQLDVRKAVFTRLTKDKELFKKKIYGALYVVSYHALSNDFLPQQCRGLRFYEADLDKLVNTV